MDRRRSDSINKNVPPIVKVVGFRVEGVAPSPSPHPTLLGDASDTMHDTSGSPNPVIIPPTFLVGHRCPHAYWSVGFQVLLLPFNDHHACVSPGFWVAQRSGFPSGVGGCAFLYHANKEEAVFSGVQSESPLHAAASARTNPFSPHAGAVGSAPVHVSCIMIIARFP